MAAEHTSVFPVEKFLLALALILVSSKVLGEIVERIRQPAVLGELFAGVLLGGSVLALLPSGPGAPGFETFHLLAEVGVAILLFEIGLETDLRDMIRVGLSSFAVAVVGVVTPFVLGAVVVLVFEKMGILGGSDPRLVGVVAITAGATLTATSVGITARVLSEMNLLRAAESRIVLGAAVIDDVLGLMILAVVTGLVEAVEGGSAPHISFLTVGVISLKAFGFLIGSVVLGNLFSRRLFDVVNKMRVRGVLLLSALAFAFIFAYFAKLVGLAPIVGSFAAGLVLANTNQVESIETRLKPVADVFTPIFFIMVGAAVDVRVFNPFHEANLPVLLIAAVLTVVAIVGKVIAGYAVVQKGLNKIAIGVGMIPRGEVGLIFAQFGLISGVFDTRMFSAITVMVMLTTFVAPPLLKVAFGADRIERARIEEDLRLKTSGGGNG